MEWARPKIDLEELARLRWIKKWPTEKIAVHFGRKYYTIQMYIIEMRKSQWMGLKLLPEEIKKIKTADESKFWLINPIRKSDSSEFRAEASNA